MKSYWIFGSLVTVILMTALLVYASDGNFPNVRESPVNEGNASAVSQSEMPDGITSTDSQDEHFNNDNDFAYNLFRTIYERNGGESSINVSPISVGYLLGMLHEGADGETRRQINNVLGLGGSVQEINEYFKKLMDEAPNVDPTVTVKTANSMFVVSGYKLIPQYKADMQNYYNALADEVGYDESSIVDRINNWCKKNTDGMIPEILKKGELNPNRVMYLLNAVYFKASWTEKFDPNETRDRNFTKRDGTTVTLPMMHLLTTAAYGENNLCKLLRLPYGNKGYSMVVMLPNEGKTVGDIINSLSAQRLKEQLQQMRSTRVDILLPRFTAGKETNLAPILSSMGMPRAFLREVAEFPNMVHDKALFVSMMKQMAKIEVNEEGTKAAAVTVAEMSERSAVPSRLEYREFHATRPFVYYIVENSTCTIYFMGTYCGEEGKQVENHGRNDNSSDEIFTVVEQMPQFPGGEAALKEYIDSHIQWPPEAGCAQGRVIVRFVVDKTGKVGEVKVVRSIEENLDKEAVRICKSLPDFIPGRQNGQVVSVWYTLPVIFKMKGKAQ